MSTEIDPCTKIDDAILIKPRISSSMVDSRIQNPNFVVVTLKVDPHKVGK